jgi:hypothetical protein
LSSANANGATNKTKNASSKGGGRQPIARGRGRGRSGTILEGDLLNGLTFECVVSIWEICNGDPLFYVILDL